ncbi:MAG: hypothetical protein JG761_1163 [Proteiniphilum sp.]|nr:hypothetical protein [Proteiniphilum sp.]
MQSRNKLFFLFILTSILRVNLYGNSQVLKDNPANEYLYDYLFFDNSLMDDSYYYSKTGYTTPSWIKNLQSRLPVSERFFSPGNALELTYTSAREGKWYCEVQHQPVRGIDFFHAPDVLSFQLFMEKPFNSKALPEIAIRYRDSTYSKQLKLADYVPGNNPNKWYHVQIPLNDFEIKSVNNTNIQELAAVAFYPGVKDGKQYTLYLDDIELLPQSLPEVASFLPPVLKEVRAYERHIDVAWAQLENSGIKYYRIYRSKDGISYHPIGISRPWINRYADYVGETGYKAWYKVSAIDYALNESPFSDAIAATTYPMTDEQLLDMVQEAHFRYYWEGAEPHSGLAREDIPGRRDMIATGASGFGIMAIIVGTERGFITRDEAVERLTRITSFLSKADKFHGAVSHFMDGSTGKTIPYFGTKDNGGDLVETSFLAQGLLAARQYFTRNTDNEKLIRERIDTFWRGIEWNWYKRYSDSPFLYWHWSPDQAWVIDHRLIGWNETMITYLLAIMSPTYAIEPEMYYSGWASPSETAQVYRKNWGKTEEGSQYVNGKTYYGLKLDVGVSNGGPLFFTHYSYMGLNPQEFTDRFTNYFHNNLTIARINYRYCMENPGNYDGYGADCWGLTASDFAWGYQAQEPVPFRDNGTIAPTGALASFPYTPEGSMAALKNYYRNYGHFLWGAYGFRDAFNLTENWCSPIFMGLNQAPVAVMIENYRSGLLWKLFMSHPDVREGLEKLNNIR